MYGHKKIDILINEYASTINDDAQKFGILSNYKKLNKRIKEKCLADPLFNAKVLQPYKNTRDLSKFIMDKIAKGGWDDDEQVYAWMEEYFELDNLAEIEAKEAEEKARKEKQAAEEKERAEKKAAKEKKKKEKEAAKALKEAGKNTADDVSSITPQSESVIDTAKVDASDETESDEDEQLEGQSSIFDFIS